MATLRPRKCPVCKNRFFPTLVGQRACSPECAYAKVVAVRTKEQERAHKARKKALRTKSDWLKLTQVEFNAYIRLRDQIANRPCVSCGRFHNGQWHAGHYRTTAAAPELRFNELNCHRQCQPCNMHHSGRIVEYRIELVRRIGTSLVEWIEQDHPQQRWSIEELKALRAYYRDAQKAMKVSPDLPTPF